MNAFRKIRLIVLVAVVAVFAVGALSSTAEAGGCHSSYYGGSFAKYSSCYGGACYPTPSVWPVTYNCVKPYCYPVTQYDCYGRPYIVWQTSYGTNPLW